jgi:hypothetical protein
MFYFSAFRAASSTERCLEAEAIGDSPAQRSFPNATPRAITAPRSCFPQFDVRADKRGR